MNIGLLPGLRGDPTEFDKLVAQLLGRGNIRVLELPATTDDTLDAIAGRLGGLNDLDLRGLDVLIGASFGGLVGRALAASGLTRARLVLIGALPHPEAPPAARRCRALGWLVPNLPAPIYRHLYARRARSEWAMDSPAPFSTSGLPTKVVLGARLRAIGRWGLPPLPSGTLCCWGERDRFVTWTGAQVIGWGGIPLPLPGAHRPHVADAPGTLTRIGAALGWSAAAGVTHQPGP